MTATEHEREFKLRAAAPLAPAAIEAALTGAGARFAEPTTARHFDLYLDDPQRNLLRHGIGLRVRRGDDAAEVGVKDSGQRLGALHQRRELAAPWPSGDPPASAADLPPRLRDAIEPYVLGRPLQPFVALETERRRWLLIGDDGPLAELAADLVQADVGGRRAGFFELELEVCADLDACARLAAHLEATLPVAPAEADKLRHTLCEVGVLEPAIEPTPPATLGELLAGSLQEQLRALRTAEVAFRLDGDPAAVHRFRVVLRRLRALVRTFHAAWPPAEAALARQWLAALARELGPLREGDVLAARLAELVHDLPPALATAEGALRDHLARVRAAALSRAGDAVRSAAHLADLARLESIVLGAIEPDLADLPPAAALVRLRQVALAARRRLRDLGDRPSIGELHDVRLALKRLRVLTEETATVRNVLGGRSRRRLARAIARLGTLCDRETAARWCTSMLADGAPIEPPVAGMLGAIAALQHRTLPRATQAALRSIRRLDRRSFWGRFRR